MDLAWPVILTGIVGALGFLSLKFLVEPYLNYRKIVADIEYALRYYASVSGMTRRELQDEAHNAFRSNASRLQPSIRQSLFLKTLSAWNILPSIGSIDEAYRGLIGLSNAVYNQGDQFKHQHRQRVIKNLRLKGFD
jgi:hypothetical protein